MAQRVTRTGELAAASIWFVDADAEHEPQPENRSHRDERCGNARCDRSHCHEYPEHGARSGRDDEGYGRTDGGQAEQHQSVRGVIGTADIDGTARTHARDDDDGGVEERGAEEQQQRERAGWVCDACSQCQRDDCQQEAEEQDPAAGQKKSRSPS